ncbi:MAG: hypothetical protein JWO89_403 [Verrucomicrobiaceae bacterium]|nr:hypothetical protein [Verrucomicrobiaceae bacterium]MDB6116646.1 hypothetical protein [Verrucomicrobiaceae bacterium]
MKRTKAARYLLAGFSAIQMTLVAEDNKASPGTSSQLQLMKPIDAASLSDPRIIAEERKAQFQRLDADADGRLTDLEFSRITGLARRIGSGIGTAGANTPEPEGNALIPTGDIPQLFKQLEANKDGVLTLDEFQRIPLSKPSEVLEAVNTDNANITRSTGANVGRPSLSHLDRSALFHRLDKNEDGSLDMTEFGKMTGTELPSQDHGTVFHRLDLDNNSKISKEEFRKLPEGPATPPNANR